MSETPGARVLAGAVSSLALLVMAPHSSSDGNAESSAAAVEMADRIES